MSAKKEKLYRYSGPLSSVVLDDGETRPLHPNKPIRLPADASHVKALEAQNLLVEEPETTPAKRTAKGVK